MMLSDVTSLLNTRIKFTRIIFAKYFNYIFEYDNESNNYAFYGV